MVSTTSLVHRPFVLRTFGNWRGKKVGGSGKQALQWTQWKNVENPLINPHTSLTDYYPMPATICRCCGTAIIDMRERCKISSNTVRPFVPILIHLLGEHYHGKRQLYFLVACLKVFIYAGSLVSTLCRGFRSQKRSSKVWKTSITQQFAVACRQNYKNILAT